MWADTAMMEIRTYQGLQGLVPCVGFKSADYVVGTYIPLLFTLNGTLPQNQKVQSDLGINKLMLDLISS